MWEAGMWVERSNGSTPQTRRKYLTESSSPTSTTISLAKAFVCYSHPPNHTNTLASCTKAQRTSTTTSPSAMSCVATTQRPVTGD